MNAIDRRQALRSILVGATAAGLGVALLPRSAAAAPIAMEKELAAKVGDLVEQVQVARPLPEPVRRRHRRRRRRWVCRWRRGRRVCGWR